MQKDKGRQRVSFVAVLGVLVAGCVNNPQPRATAGSAGSGGGTAGAGAAGAGAGGASGASSAILGGAGSMDASAGTGGPGGAAGATGVAGLDGGATDQGMDEPACADLTTDTDGDGTPDCLDGCPYDKNKVAPGVCGCGTEDNDSLGDGHVDCIPGRFYEAESGQLSQVGADGGVGFEQGADPMASGGHFIDTPAGLTSPNTPGSARATYDLVIKTNDMYVIWGRFFSPDPMHNCFWAQVDGGTWTRWWDTSGEEWFWYTLHQEADWTMPMIFQLTAGHHALVLANCSDKTKIDRLYVVAGGATPPSGVTMCNPPHSVLTGGQCAMSCGTLGGTSCDPVACAGATLLPAYDCTVCCNPSQPMSDGGTDGSGGG